MFSILGPAAAGILAKLGAGPEIQALPPAHSQLFGMGGSAPTLIASGGGLPGPGFSVILDEAGAAPLWRSLLSQVWLLC